MLYFSPWMGKCRVCWGWRHCQSHRSSLLLARVLLRIIFEILKYWNIWIFEDKNNIRYLLFKFSWEENNIWNIEISKYLKKKKTIFVCSIFHEGKKSRVANLTNIEQTWFFLMSWVWKRWRWCIVKEMVMTRRTISWWVGARSRWEKGRKEKRSKDEEKKWRFITMRHGNNWRKNNRKWPKHLFVSKPSCSY